LIEDYGQQAMRGGRWLDVPAFENQLLPAAVAAASAKASAAESLIMRGDLGMKCWSVQVSQGRSRGERAGYAKRCKRRIRKMRKRRKRKKKKGRMDDV